MSGWDRIIGHAWAVDSLRQSVVNGRIGHSYLIAGPAHIGKTTLAITFAQALNCLSKDIAVRPCGQCRACTLIGRGRHPDIKMVEGDTLRSSRPSIKIDQIRQLQQQLTLTAAEARFKIAILNQFETATASAANAFLKTLEEPPSSVILIILAAAPDAVFPTIASRCRVFSLRPLSRIQVKEALTTHWNVREEIASQLAQMSDGRIGWAISASQEPRLVEDWENQVQLLYDGIAGSIVDRFRISELISKDPESIMELLSTWLGWWRDLSLVAVGVPDYEMIVNINQINEIRRRAERWPAASALRGLIKTKEAMRQIDQNGNSRLVIENLLLAYPSDG